MSQLHQVEAAQQPEFPIPSNENVLFSVVRMLTPACLHVRSVENSYLFFCHINPNLNVEAPANVAPSKRPSVSIVIASAVKDLVLTQIVSRSWSTHTSNRSISHETRRTTVGRPASVDLAHGDWFGQSFGTEQRKTKGYLEVLRHHATLGTWSCRSSFRAFTEMLWSMERNPSTRGVQFS